MSDEGKGGGSWTFKTAVAGSIFFALLLQAGVPAEQSLILGGAGGMVVAWKWGSARQACETVDALSTARDQDG